MLFNEEYEQVKAKFYANPVLASLIGLAIGFILGVILF